MRLTVCRRCGGPLPHNDEEETKNGFCKEDWEIVSLFVYYFRKEATREVLIRIAPEGLAAFSLLNREVAERHPHLDEGKQRDIAVNRFRMHQLPMLLKKHAHAPRWGTRQGRKKPAEKVQDALRIIRSVERLNRESIKPGSCVQRGESLLPPARQFSRSESSFLEGLRHDNGLRITIEEGRMLIAYRRRFLMECAGQEIPKTLALRFRQRHAMLTLEDIRRLLGGDNRISRPSALA